jgi:flagellar basal body-associated protein FliL
MAENERDERLDEDSMDGDESNEEKKGLSKPLIIKIAIGVTILLIGVGSYFFFIPKDKSPEQESISEVDNLVTSDGNTEPDMATKLLGMREEAVTLREENLSLKQRIMELESQNNLKEEIAKPEEVTTDKKATNIKQKAPVGKLNTDQYIVNYQDEPDDYRSRYEANSEAAPEPKWGEFAPLYRGE